MENEEKNGYSRTEGEESRPEQPNRRDGEGRSYYGSREAGDERRPFRPRYNDGGDQQQRPFRPRYNDGGDQQQRPFRPRYNDGGDQQRPFRPRYNDGGDQQQRPFRPRYNDGGDQQQRPFRPRYNDGGDNRGFGGHRPFGDNRGGFGNRRPFGGNRNAAPRQQWKVADDAKRGPRYKIDRRIFDNEADVEQNGTDPEMQQMPASLRLNRFVAMSGVCSRREADELIKNGKIKVNGEVITEMGVTVSPDAQVEYDGRILKAEKKVYVLLNKPKDTVTTTDDPEGRRTVMDIVAGACKERIYPVGRLDRSTTGILLLTNDGEMAEKLMHPKYEVRKIYHVFLDKPVEEADLEKLIKGIELEDGPINADEVSFVDGRDHKQVGVVIHSGRNRIVRRMFEHLGYNVERLDRVYYGGLTKLNVPRGHWRYLTDEEINKLKAGFTK